jgi:hypothetical protein
LQGRKGRAERPETFTFLGFTHLSAQIVERIHPRSPKAERQDARAFPARDSNYYNE